MLDREEWIRLAMHLPWGAMGAWIAFGCPIPFLLEPIVELPLMLAGLFATFSMFVYEVFNDWRKKDHSYKDVVGIVWGFLILAILLTWWWRW